MQQNTQEENNCPIQETFGWGCICIAIVIIYTIALLTFFCDWDKRGQFGDAFGALNCLVSALAFIGLLSSLKQQREMLEIQKNEISLLKNESKGQTEKFKESISLEMRNQFMDDFYRRLELLDKQSDNLYYKDLKSQTILYGNEAWDNLKEITISYINCYHADNEQVIKTLSFNKHLKSYEYVYTWYMSVSNLVFDLIQLEETQETKRYTKMYYMRILLHSMSSVQKEFFYYYLYLYKRESRTAQRIYDYMVNNQFITPKNEGEKKYIFDEDSDKEFLMFLKSNMDV